MIDWLNCERISRNSQKKDNYKEGDFNVDIHRSPFNRDIGSIVHSYDFRKLSHKTQVHLNPQNDYPRTRLSHSLEVAQVGVQLAKTLAHRIMASNLDVAKKYKLTQRSLEGDLAELTHAAALAHDIGHPPFGHEGENQLSLLLNDRFELCFEANKQNIHILLKKDFGMTAALLDAVTKYKTSEVVDKAGGAYGCDENLLKTAWKKTNTGMRRHPISYIMEAADDICYLSSDIEDALKLGVIEPSELLPLVRDLPILDNQLRPREKGKWNKIVCEQSPREIASYLLRAGLDHVYKGFDNLDFSKDIVEEFHCFDKGRNYGDSHFNLLYWKNDQNSLGEKFDELKDNIYYEKILKHQEIIHAEYLARETIQDIWDILMRLNGQTYDKVEKEPLFHLIPQYIQKEILEALKVGSEKDFGRSCADFISGMTDRYALQFWESMKMPSRYLSSAA